MTRHFVACAVVGVLAVSASHGAAADGPPYSLTVKRSHMLRSSAGTLRITMDGIEYDTAAKKEARRWTYADIQQLLIQAPTQIVVLSYEDQGRLKLGADRRFAFEIREGRVTQEMVAFLLSRTDRSLVTAVLPHLPAAPLFQVPVKHERYGRGSDGTLRMYDEALVYVADREGETRYWRFKDLYAVLSLDRYRYEVLAYEGGSGDLRTFTFQLKADLPDAFARTLWARVNTPPR
jgi:hypothetical protein